MAFVIEIIVLLVVLGLIWRYLGSYLTAVFTGRVHFLDWIELPLLRLLGIQPGAEQSWRRYLRSLLVFSLVSLVITYLLLALQGHLPLNPEHLGDVTPALAFNTAVSFLTNTNWQNYAGGTTMSYLSQMVALATQNFVSAAVGLAVAIAVIRGFSRKRSSTLGNFWIDTIRGVFYVLLPISIVMTLVFVWQGAPQTLLGPAHIHDVLNGVHQTILRGPVASQEVIKQLGTNGGGFFNANSAHPFENPTGFTNFLEIVLILCIPVALTYTFGKMVGNIKEGVAVLMAMIILFAGTFAFTLAAEKGGNPAVHAAGITSTRGNMVGKESRFGVDNSVLFNVTSTQTSTGSVNSSADSYTPIGGLGMLAGMMYGEVSPGGIGSGIYTILIFAILTVFIAGLMVGRTPEYVRKKIQKTEIIWASIGVLVMPITVLILTAITVALPDGRAAILNHGPHGFSEILYAFTSQGNNNGSAFAGLSSNTAYFNITGAIAMLIGRFGVIVPVMALAGSLAAKEEVPVTAGTFLTATPMFTGLLVGVILLVGALNFFPAVALGPIAEAVSHGRFF
ncbi:MAG: potassium-transporting ATPase subunit KdpA [Ferrimicrobium sp.]|uniref:potassium-transporting ATPase subunit KdpA n=1 Tax=Ferrimicrobium sp. TaxID=2926050 RepID=UPI00261F1F1E|nr:potassium-transporting ATPase subunit KdpA [Ferrimicrobium sp.]